MKKAFPWIVVAVIVLAVFLWVKNSYNSIVTADEATADEAAADEAATDGETVTDETPADEGADADEAQTDAGTASGANGSNGVYVVEKGDTLAIISKKMYGDVSHIDAICRMNGISDGNLIYIGQKLLLP